MCIRDRNKYNPQIHHRRSIRLKGYDYSQAGLYFNETISNFETEKLLVLDIKTDPKNIPPTVMDEHILIGGKPVSYTHLDVYKRQEQIQ